MLEMTTQAEEAIKGILDSDGIPDGASFRISSQEAPEPGAESGFAVAITEEAPPEDQVVEGEDVTVRLEPVAAELLDDKQLDASIADGQVQFSLTDRSG